MTASVLVPLLGLAVFCAVAWLAGERQGRFPMRTVAGGLVLQFVLAGFILRSTWGQQLFAGASRMAETFVSLSDEGARFVFGPGFEEHLFAFKVLPTIIFVSAVSQVLFFYGILQRVVSGMAWVMRRSMGVSGPESLAAAANVFLGPSETPLLIKPYILHMTRSELACLMTGGFATVAGGVLAAYVGMGVSGGHLLAASLMGAPAAIVFSKIMVPERRGVELEASTRVSLKSDCVNVLDAACLGASEGLRLALEVGAMLIAFIALVAGINLVLGHLGQVWGYGWTLEGLFGLVARPVAWLMGVSWAESLDVGTLIGKKVVLNEFIAYADLGTMQGQGRLSAGASAIATYALCGFANFSTIAIQVGAIGGLVPERKADFAQLGLRTLLAGNLAGFANGCVAAIWLG